jgi:hypothetical protein
MPDLDAVKEKLHRYKNQDAIKKCIQEHLKIVCPTVVFVYTSPKVGSTSIVSSLRIFASKKMNVFHYHGDSLLPREYRDQGVTINDIIHYCANVLNKKVYVMDVYRTPIEKKMSAYFDRLAVHHFNTPESVFANATRETVMPRLIQRFNKLFPHIGTDDYMFEQYGDAILEKMPTEFPHAKRVLEIECDGINYIKLRLMDSLYWGGILSSIFGMHIELATDYVGRDRVLGKLYEDFKKSYAIPKMYLDLIRSEDTRIKYYLSESEHTTYFDKWDKYVSHEDIVCVPFTESEYQFYTQISTENSYMDYVQKNTEHYLDEGCICDACMLKRKSVADILIHNPQTKNINNILQVHHTVSVKQHIEHRASTVIRAAAVAASTNNLRRSGNRNRKRRINTRSRSYSIRMKLFN